MGSELVPHVIHAFSPRWLHHLSITPSPKFDIWFIRRYFSRGRRRIGFTPFLLDSFDGRIRIRRLGSGGDHHHQIRQKWNIRLLIMKSLEGVLIGQQHSRGRIGLPRRVLNEAMAESHGFDRQLGQLTIFRDEMRFEDFEYRVQARFESRSEFGIEDERLDELEDAQSRKHEFEMVSASEKR